MTRILLKRIFKTAFNPRSFWVRTSTAYFLLMSLIPTVGIIALFMDIFNIPLSVLIPYLSFLFPEGSAKMIEDYLLATEFNLDFIPLVLTLVFSFNISTGGIDTLSMLSNDMFGFENVGYIKRKIRSVILMVIIVVGLILLLVMSMLFPRIFSVGNLYSVMFPLMWGGLFLVITLLFIYTPSKRMRFRDIFAGSLFSSLTIALLLQFFGVYIKYFGRFDTFFGPLASVIILLILFDWMALMLYFGISINVVIYDTYKKKKKG